MDRVACGAGFSSPEAAEFRGAVWVPRGFLAPLRGASRLACDASQRCGFLGRLGGLQSWKAVWACTARVWCACLPACLLACFRARSGVWLAIGDDVASRHRSGQLQRYKTRFPPLFTEPSPFTSLNPLKATIHPVSTYTHTHAPTT